MKIFKGSSAAPAMPAQFALPRLLAALVILIAVGMTACTFGETEQRTVSGAGIGAAVGAAGGAIFGAMAGVPGTGAAIGAGVGAAVGGAGGYVFDQQTRRQAAEAESERLRRENEALKAQ